MALVGASGSGKSTLLNLLAGLMDPDEGEVRLNDVHVATPGEKLVPGHPDIRLVHQEYQLMPNITVRQNIAYAVRYYQKDYQTYRVNELLRLCRLEAVADRIPRQISGGEKQRTAIARAIAEPSADGRAVILLLDEPFSHLDLPNRTHIRDLLLDLVREAEPGEPASFACLFVTHDATDALALSDEVGVMQDGELIQLGTPQTVYRQPETAYVAQMTGPANIMAGGLLPTLHLSATADPDQLVCIRPGGYTGKSIRDSGCDPGGVIPGRIYRITGRSRQWPAASVIYYRSGGQCRAAINYYHPAGGGAYPGRIVTCSARLTL